MQTFFLFALIIASVGLMVIAISKWKIHPFIVMTVIALLVGLIWGTVYPESELTPAKVVSSVKSGFGDIMTSIGIVILCGTIIGTILEKTGAALTMANAILKLVGKKRSVVAMGASTVAMITTAGMMAPLMETMGYTSPLAKVLVVMAIGAGSMVASHANDSYFWVVSQFSDMKTEEAYKCQTGMTAVMGITIIILLFVISLFI